MSSESSRSSKSKFSRIDKLLQIYVEKIIYQIMDENGFDRRRNKKNFEKARETLSVMLWRRKNIKIAPVAYLQRRKEKLETLMKSKMKWRRGKNDRSLSPIKLPDETVSNLKKLELGVDDVLANESSKASQFDQKGIIEKVASKTISRLDQKPKQMQRKGQDLMAAFIPPPPLRPPAMLSMKPDARMPMAARASVKFPPPPRHASVFFRTMPLSLRMERPLIPRRVQNFNFRLEKSKKLNGIYR